MLPRPASAVTFCFAFARAARQYRAMRTARLAAVFAVVLLFGRGAAMADATVSWQLAPGARYDTLIIGGTAVTPAIYSDAQALGALLKANELGAGSGIVPRVIIPSEAWDAAHATIAWPRLPTLLQSFFERITTRDEVGYESPDWHGLRYLMLRSITESGVKYGDLGGKFVSWTSVKAFWLGRNWLQGGILDLVDQTADPAMAGMMGAGLPPELQKLLDKNHVVVHRHIVNGM
jgi:hypothetical protein